MSGRLTTHVLDTSRGRPAAGVPVTLRRDGVVVAQTVTNDDGRTDAPLAAGGAFTPGVFELTFALAGYFGEDAFFGDVPVRFRVADAGEHHHVPLLVSPFGYSTYRGS